MKHGWIQSQGVMQFYTLAFNAGACLHGEEALRYSIIRPAFFGKQTMQKQHTNSSEVILSPRWPSNGLCGCFKNCQRRVKQGKVRGTKKLLERKHMHEQRVWPLGTGWAFSPMHVLSLMPTLPGRMAFKMGSVSEFLICASLRWRVRSLFSRVSSELFGVPDIFSHSRIPLYKQQPVSSVDK